MNIIGQAIYLYTLYIYTHILIKFYNRLQSIIPINTRYRVFSNIGRQFGDWWGIGEEEIVFNQSVLCFLRIVRQGCLDWKWSWLIQTGMNFL